MEHQYLYKANVLRVVDGDSVDFKIDLGFGIFHDIKIRLLGINAPETSTPEGKVSRDWLKQQLPAGTPVLLLTQRDKKEKYGRYLGTIYLNGLDMNEELVKSGHAVLYDGGAR